tara:strand:+ start:3610 stop:16836 length:13227 start_codon:yes stop_codon:yes gene_type:complete
MAQSNNDSIIQQFLNTSTPVQEPDPSAYDFIGQADTAVTTPPPSEDTIARARLAFAKNTSKRNIDTAKTVLQAKKALGIDPRVAMHEQYMQGIDTRNEGLTTLQSNIHNNPGNVEKGQGYAGETGDTYANDRKIPFVDFDTPQMGVRAVFMDMRSKMGEFSGNLLDMINKYAPPNENNTQAYYENIKSRLNGKEIVDESDMAELVKAIITQENTPETASYYLNDPTILDEAYALSKIQLPNGATYQQAKLQLGQQLPGTTGADSLDPVTSFTSGRIPADIPVEPQRSVGSTTVEEEVITPPLLADPPAEEEKETVLEKLGRAGDQLISGLNQAGDILSDKDKYIDAKEALVDGASRAPGEALEGVKKSGDIIATKLGLKSDPDPELPPASTINYYDLVNEAAEEEAGTSNRLSIMDMDVSPQVKASVLKLTEAPSMKIDSPIIKRKGDKVFQLENQTWVAILNGKPITNLSEKEATYYATRFEQDAAKQANGAYEEWSVGDVKNYLMGSIAQPVAAGFSAALVGEQSLQGRANDYNALKGAQPLLNDKKTDLTPADIKLFNSILTSKTLTPEQEAFKNDSKFGVLSKLQKEANNEKEQAKNITDYADKWKSAFPTNDAGFQASQSIYDLIAEKDGEFAAVWEMLKNHKAAYAKEGLGSAAYSLALVSGGLVTQSAVLTSFIMDESQRAKAKWVEKNGAENYTPDVQSSIENWMALKVISQKISLGYLDKVVGKAIPGGRKKWIKQMASKLNSTTPTSIKILAKIGGKGVSLASGVGGEALQGGGEVLIEAQLPEATLNWREVYQGALAEGLGSLSLGPTMAVKNLTEATVKSIIQPSNKERLKKGLQAEKTRLEEKIQRIEKFEKETNPKDLANFEKLTEEIVGIESALVELTNVSMNAKSGELKIDTKNTAIKELFEKHKSLANKTNATSDDVIDAIRSDLEATLLNTQTEFDALESRIPQVITKQRSIREVFAGASDTTTIRVKDTEYGKGLEQQVEKYEEDIKKIENDKDTSDVQKIIAIETRQKQINELGQKLEETAKPSLLKAEKVFLQTQLEKRKIQVEGDKAGQEIINVQINKDAGTDISDEDVAFQLEEIGVLDDRNNPNYIPIEENDQYGPGDIVDLKNDENPDNIDAQGYVIEEIIGLSRDGKVYVRLKGVTDAVQVDQLIPRVRPDETPRTILEKFQALTQRNLSDAAQKLVQAKFDEFITKYAPKDDGKGGKTFGSIDDSYEEHEKLSIDEAKKKQKDIKNNPDSTPEDLAYWDDQVNRKQEQSQRAKKEEQADKTMGDVHSEILEGESKKWKGLAKYHEEIINAYKNLVDPVIRDRNIRAITSKMRTHATNLTSKLAAFGEADRMIPNLASGMGAVVIGSIDLASPKGVRQMNYKVQPMPLTEADAKAQAKAKGTEYREGQSFESRKNNGQFVTLITDKTHKFKDFTIKRSSGLISNLQKESEYGKLIMGSVEGYKKTSMAQNAANQQVKIEAKQKVYDQLVQLRGKLPRIIKEISEKDREKIRVDKEKESKPLSLIKQLEKAEKELEALQKAFDNTEKTDETKLTLEEDIDKLKKEIDSLTTRIAEESTKNGDSPGKDKPPKSPPPGSDEVAPDVRESAEATEGKKGEQFEFPFTGKNFIETATRMYHAVVGGKLETVFGLVGKKFTDLVNVGKKTTILGLQNLADTNFADENVLAKSLEALGIDSKAAKVLANRYFKFKTRFDKTLFHSIKIDRKVVLLAKDGNSKEELAAAGETFTVSEIDGTNKTVTIHNQNVTGDDTWTVPLNDVVDAENYAIRQPLSLLYREDLDNADNQQGTLPEQVVFSMMIGAMSWRQRTTDNDRFGGSEYGMEAFLYNNQQKLDSDEKVQLDQIGYGYNDVARQIGNDISQMLHLSPKNANGELSQEGIDIYFEHLIPALGMAAIETAQGTDSESYFIKDIHKWDFDDADRSADGRVYNNNPTGSQEETDEFGYRHLKIDENRPPSEEGLSAVKSLTETLELNIHSNAGPLQSPKDIKTDVSGTFGDVPLEVQRLMKKLHKVEWSKSEPMDIVSDLFEDHYDVLKEVLGIEELYETNKKGDYVYEVESGSDFNIRKELAKITKQANNLKKDNPNLAKLRTKYAALLEEQKAILAKKGQPKLDKAGEPIKKGLWHKRDMAAKEAANRDKLLSLERLVKANDKNELEKFYFTYNLQNHHRIMQEGKINPQQSKVDRFLLKSWEPKTYTDKNMWKFELAVAQNFGTKIDKETYGVSKAAFNDVLDDPIILEAVNAYQTLTKARALVESTKLKKANTTKHKNAVAAKKAAAKEFAEALSAVKFTYKKGNMSLLQGIAGLANYMVVTPVKSARLGFRKTPNTTFKSDIVMEIDGISNGFAMNVMQFPMWENMPEMLAKVATYFGKDTEHNTKAPDTYETLAEYVQKGMGDGTMNIENNTIPYEYITENNWKDDYDPLSIYKKRKSKYRAYSDRDSEFIAEQLRQREKVIESRGLIRAWARKYYSDKNTKILDWAKLSSKTNKKMSMEDIKAEDELYVKQLPYTFDSDIAAVFNEMTPGPERTKAFNEFNKIRKLQKLDPIKPLKSGSKASTKSQEAAFNATLDREEKIQSANHAKAHKEFLTDYNQINGALNTVYSDFTGEVGEELRSVVKYPFIIHMYGGGIDRISKDVTKDIIGHIYEQVGLLQQQYNDALRASPEAAAFFEEYKSVLPVDNYENIESGVLKINGIVSQIEEFAAALETLGAFKQDNKGNDKNFIPQNAEAFVKAMTEGNGLDKYFNENYLRANISTTIAPRFDHGLKTMLEPTQAARDAIVQMGGLLHGIFMAHFTQAYEKKISELNDGRSTLTKKELTALIKDAKGTLIKVYPQYAGPLSAIDENGNTEGFVDLAKTKSVSTIQEKVGVPSEDIINNSSMLTAYIEDNVDNLTDNARKRLIKIVNSKSEIHIDSETKTYLIEIINKRNKFEDERVEYRNAKQNKDGTYDSATSTTHNTFPQQLKFIEPGVAALIRQIINMDSVLLTQTMNGDPNIKVNGQRWVGDVNVLMLHDAFMASPEQLSEISEAYGQLFLHYNRTHSVIEKTYDQLKKALALTKSIDDAAPEGTPLLMDKLDRFIRHEFFDNKNKKAEAKLLLADILKSVDITVNNVAEARVSFEELASENGGLSESLQMLMQRPEQSQSLDEIITDVLHDLANETAENKKRNKISKTPIQEQSNKSFDANNTLTQTEFDFSKKDVDDLKNSLMSEKGEISKKENLNDITRNTVQSLFGDFTKLSGNYYNTAEEAANHTDTLSRVIGILSEGFDSTAGIQLTYEQIQGITQGSYSQAFERMVISKSQQSPTTRNGQSPQEAYAHELLHAMTGIGLDQSPLVRQRIEKLYDNVLDTLGRKYGKGQEYKVFLPSNTGPTNLATSKEILMARELFNHAFYAKESHRLHEFMAFANTNASLSNFMKQNDVAQRTDLYGRMLSAIKYIVDTIKLVLNQKVYNPTDLSQVAEAVAITEQLVAAQNKYKSKHEQIRSKGYKALDASDQIIRKFANNAFKAYERAAKQASDEGKDIETASVPLKVATGLIMVPYIYFGEHNAVQEIRNSAMEKLNYSLRGILKEFGDGVLSPGMIEQLLQSKVNISKQRQLAETFQIDWFNGNKANGVNSIWQSLDPTKDHAMSVETREALTNVMLRTDISQLITAGLDLDSPAGMKKIISLIGKDPTAGQERGLLKQQILKKLNVSGAHPAVKYASELAHWMMTGNTERLSNARQNAYSIALDYLPNPTEERVGLLDAFATISALGEIDSRDAENIGELANKEFAANPNENGIISIMQAHVHYKAKSRRDLFDGDPTQMMKGYIVERMDNLTDIKIGTPEEKDAMYEQGYTYEVPLSKIAAGQTHYIMYVNRNKPEVKDVSGVMSTTNQRNQGTTLTEILSLNDKYKDPVTKKPDMFMIRAEVKKFKKHQDKLAKQLSFDSRFKFRPIFDQNNVITDYRILMNHKDTKKILKPDLEFQNVFAHMHSNLVDRKNTIINDKETIHLLVHEQEDLYKTYPNQFVNILDPESKYFDRYQKMPRAIREYMQEFAVSGKFMVRIDIIDKVFGYKQIDITQAKIFENNQHPFLKQMAGLAHYTVKETVSYGKNRVVLAVPKVIIGNMMSNVAQLLMRKISLPYITNKLLEGLSEYKRYSKDTIKMRKLQYQIDTKNLNSTNSAEAQEVARLKVRIESNKIHAMNEAGVDSLIIEDLNDAQLDGYFNRMSRILFKGNLKHIGDKIPRTLQTVAHTLFWTKESLPYKYSKQVVQMTDFMGRYVMMEHSQNVLGHSFKKSLHDSLESFVLFDESLIAPLEMLDAIGATAFLSYWLRNQRAVKKLVQANPSSVAISAVVQEMTGIPTLGNVNSAWMGGDFFPNLAQTDDLWDEANNVTLFEALSQIKGGF